MSKKDHKENKTAEAELNKETQNTEETAELNEQEIEESNEVVEEAASEDATNNNEESEQVALIEKLEKELNDTIPFSDSVRSQVHPNSVQATGDLSLIFQ